jgi:hypothetical protein
MRFTMEGMSTAYDLTYDPNEVGGDMVVECWISHGPRSGDPDFDPQPGECVLAGDDEEPPRRARVVSRSGNRVWIQLELPSSVNQVA